ncbi:ThuA domain-containing protein [Glycomyces arizonensis]|uniref:ThuA domain-containing protein n=1 Tax=Glycomyces arizonensis TaxID=256035 RepID=UPI0004215C79|nr:ThuA domain-containing protein [Glycomyces arizonensis]
MSAQGTKRALIVRGGWDGHHPVAATDSFIPFLTENGYEVRVENATAVYADAGYMASVDLVVQTNTMNTIERDELNGLRTAIEHGTGMAGWHGGIADSYRSSSDYLQLIGGQFATHPTRAPEDELNGDETDCFTHYTVNIVPEKADHPIVKGIEDFELTTEQYWVLSDEYNEVLATTTIPVTDHHPWHAPITCPAVWTRLWGEGRIFVATPGHDMGVLADANVRTIIERGLLWAGR